MGRVGARHAGRLRRARAPGRRRRAGLVRPAARLHGPRARPAAARRHVAARLGARPASACGCTRARSTARRHCAPTRRAGWRSTTSGPTRRLRTSRSSRGRAPPVRGRHEVDGRRLERDRRQAGRLVARPRRRHPPAARRAARVRRRRRGRDRGARRRAARVGGPRGRRWRSRSRRAAAATRPTTRSRAGVAEDPDPASIRVVTSDATLAGRAREHGAQVEGAGAFRRRLGI